MNHSTQDTNRIVFMADDDEDDCILVREAVGEISSNILLHCFEDGIEFMEHLSGATSYPSFILLDLNMPKRMDDRF